LRYYSSLMKKMRWIKLNKELNLYSSNLDVKKTRVLREIRTRAFPHYFKSKESPYILPEVISMGLAKRTNIYESLEEKGLYPLNTDLSLNDIRKQHFSGLNNWNITGTTGTRLSLINSLRSHDPTNDLRVVRFCLSVPIEQYIREGLGRSLIRRSTKGYLPDKVRLNQRTRGIQGVDVIQRMSSKWQSFMDEYDYMCSDPLAQEFLNVEVLRTAKENMQTNYALDPNFRVMMRSVIVYRFLKKLKGGEVYEESLAGTSIGST
jgi:asparagine synthase (glutamine-hydrolysing)